MAGVDFPTFETPDDTMIWRYMRLPAYHDLLRGELYFPAAHQFDDRFEGAINECRNCVARPAR
jgi:hypothetical protein